MSGWAEGSTGAVTEVPEFSSAAAAGRGMAPAAWAKAAVISAELRWTSAGAWPAALGFSSSEILFWNDSALAATAAGAWGGARGCGLLKSMNRTVRETASEARLMMRLSFMPSPVPLQYRPYGSGKWRERRRDGRCWTGGCGASLGWTAGWPSPRESLPFKFF